MDEVGDITGTHTGQLESYRVEFNPLGLVEITIRVVQLLQNHDLNLPIYVYDVTHSHLFN